MTQRNSILENEVNVKIVDAEMKMYYNIAIVASIISLAGVGLLIV